MNIYESNIAYVQSQIQKKKTSTTPFFSSTTEVVTDFDHFPYTRHFRGEYDNHTPIVFGRDAGWRPRRDDCYKYQYDPVPDIIKPRHCFSGACNGVKPCKPEELNPILDKEASDLTFQTRHIIDYR